MMTTRPGKLLAIAWLALMTSASAWGATNSTDLAAINELPRLRQLVTHQNFALMGFQTTQEVYVATVSLPAIDVRQVVVHDLAVYQPLKNPSTLLQPATMRIYPVIVSNEIRCSITFAEYPQGWKPVSYGYSNLAQLITRARADAAGAIGLSLDQFFAVQVRGLNALFLGYYVNNQLMLTTLIADSTLGLIGGQTKPADQIFAALVPAAQHQNGLPR
jgi:hypothetical protein